MDEKSAIAFALLMLQEKEVINTEISSATPLADEECLSANSIDYKCYYCNKKHFKAFKDLDTHLKICKQFIENSHPKFDESKVFKCPACEKSFKWRSHLRKHTITHSATFERVYKCNICSVLFTQKSCYIGHRKTHTREQIIADKMHIDDMHRDKPYTCDVADCVKRFTSQNMLRLHQNTTHNQDIDDMYPLYQRRLLAPKELSTAEEMEKGNQLMVLSPQSINKQVGIAPLPMETESGTLPETECQQVEKPPVELKQSEVLIPPKENQPAEMVVQPLVNHCDMLSPDANRPLPPDANRSDKNNMEEPDTINNMEESDTVSSDGINNCEVFSLPDKSDFEVSSPFWEKQDVMVPPVENECEVSTPASQNHELCDFEVSSPFWEKQDGMVPPVKNECEVSTPASQNHESYTAIKQPHCCQLGCGRHFETQIALTKHEENNHPQKLPLLEETELEKWTPRIPVPKNRHFFNMTYAGGLSSIKENQSEKFELSKTNLIEDVKQADKNYERFIWKKDSSGILITTAENQPVLQSKSTFKPTRLCKEKCADNLGSTIYQCKLKECNKTFTSNDAFEMHQRVCNNGVNIRMLYKCEDIQCQKQFTKPHIHLLSDRSKYSTDKASSYECLVCKLTFARNCDLAKHLRAHTTSKPFKCRHCSECYKSEKTLIKHMRIYSHW